MTHEMKSWPVEFSYTVQGRKRFEVRRDDRTPRYEAGDTILIREFVPGTQTYTGRQVQGRITYVERSECLPSGWCGFSFEQLPLLRADGMMNAEAHKFPK